MSIKVVTIILCSLLALESLFPRLELAEISKVSELLDHYKQHRIESPEIGFFEFLGMHYGDSKHFAQDAKTHQKLPFSKGHHTYLTFQIILDRVQINPALNSQLLMDIGHVAYTEGQTFSIPMPIWQPPRI